MKQIKQILSALLGFAFCIVGNSCQNNYELENAVSTASAVRTNLSSRSSDAMPFFKGADLSYTNELEDCGVQFKENGVVKDAYTLMNSYGANLIRLRLWHNPTWTNYSTLSDVKKSIKRAKALNMYVLLDFHYSDTWTDPEQNVVPAAWASVVDDTPTLADSVYNYTIATLKNLHSENLLPNMVQIGNETNKNIMVADNSLLEPVDYARNVQLFNAGLKAISDFNEMYGTNIKTVLHVAMNPNDAKNWVGNLKALNIRNFGMLGLSYYPQWQSYTPAQLGEFTSDLYKTYGIKVLVAETGHIWTREWNDNCHNLMSKMATGYPEKPCPQLQKDFLVEVKEAVRNNGGAGVIAWAPEWVSSTNVTLWGVGSNWENVAFFDFNNQLHNHGGIEFYSENNVAVTFNVDMSNAGSSAKGYITGEFTADANGNWQIFPMNQIGSSNTYTFTTHLLQGQSGAYYFLSDSVWTAKETVPESQQGKWDDRLYEISTTSKTQVISNSWSN